MNNPSQFKASSVAGRIVFWLLIALTLFFFLFPLYWMFLSSIKQPGDVTSLPPRFIPFVQFKPTLANYAAVLSTSAMGSRQNTFPWALLNSVLVGGTATVVAVILGTLTAYAFSRFRVKGESDLLFFILSTRMLPPVVVVIPIFLMFRFVNQDALRLTIGSIAIVFALNNLLGWARRRPAAQASWPRGVLWSSLSGFTSFLAHSGSAPIMAYLLPQRLDKRIYVGTTVWFFFASNYAKIVPYGVLGQLDLTNLATAAVLLPLVPLGVRLGVLIQGRLNEQVFYRISYWALLGIGAKLVYDGLTRI